MVKMVEVMEAVVMTNRGYKGDAALCDALLQCGADLEAQDGGRPLWVEVAAAAQRERDGEGERETQHEEERETDKIKVKNERNRKKQEMEKYGDGDKFGESKEDKVEGSKQEETIVIPPPGRPHCPAQAVCRLFRFYWPGLWRAVAEEDVNKVREGDREERGGGTEEERKK
ncbi:hypothetical protein E2C01_094942 [Portunus trituberculatus]|uniref:Uncharacterized protein n=1 Tax=Portunus trituberculatus TaxID=210409 RepID=A0A5B7JYJ2_PORTR|nr:hypothetical protein [Portunus trituberculatus]